MFARTVTVVSIVAATALSSGCAGIGEPSGWLPTALEAQTEAYGAWIEVRYGSESGKRERVRGEFIAVGEDTVFVLVGDDESHQLVTIPRDVIERARLSTFDPGHGGIAGWTVAGTLSTISHGFGLILTAPLWMITGSISSGAQARTRTERFPNAPWEYLKRFARFPQGLPSAVDRTALLPK
jgi:hypothetical protein